MYQHFHGFAIRPDSVNKVNYSNTFRWSNASITIQVKPDRSQYTNDVTICTKTFWITNVIIAVNVSCAIIQRKMENKADWNIERQYSFPLAWTYIKVLYLFLRNSFLLQNVIPNNFWTCQQLDNHAHKELIDVFNIMFLDNIRCDSQPTSRHIEHWKP